MNATPNPRAFLHQPLPPELTTGLTWGPFSYRRFAVFSAPWLKRRFLFTFIAVLLYAALSVLGQIVTHNTWANGLIIGAYFTLGFMLMLTAGPALATWVRHRCLSRRLETWSILAAVVIGVIGGAFADFWFSNAMKQPLRTKEVPAAERKVGDADAAALALAQVGIVFIYFAFGGGLAAFAFFAERNRIQARQVHMAKLESDMRLSVLQAQIEPHFLFNTLAAIRPLIRQDAALAETSIDALADHLRATIPQMREQSGSLFSTLGQQLEICSSYLKLMQLRMGNRLQYEVNVPPELHGLEFPPLILLSLVENAIKHGLEPKPGPGRLLVRAAKGSGALFVSVSDDGQGLKAGLSTGLGLSNIREQLAVLFGGKASLKIAGRPEGGTIAEIVLPILNPKA